MEVLKSLDRRFYLLQGKVVPTKRFQLILVVLAAASTLVLCLRKVSAGLRVDWDVDTFIYMSQRLLDGSKLYIDFYDPKWPHVLWVYMPGAISRSLHVHIISSWLAVVFTGILITVWGRRWQERESRGPICAGCLYVLLVVFLPGGDVGHLEIYANLSLGIGAALATISANRKDLLNRLQIYVSGIFIGYGLGLRPNLLIPAICVAVFMLLLKPRGRHFITQNWLLSVGIMSGLLLPFAEYIRSMKHVEIAWSGAFGILAAWNREMYPKSGFISFLSDVGTFLSPRVMGQSYTLLIIFAVVVIVYGIRRRKEDRALFASIGIAWFLGLYISYWMSHIHHHYILMDTFALCMLLAAVETSLGKRIRVGLTGIVVTMAIVTMVYPLKPPGHIDAKILEASDSVLAYLKSREGAQFSAPEDVRYHWVLGQRISTRGIHPVWSIEVLESDIVNGSHAKVLGLDGTTEEVCESWVQGRNIFVGSSKLVSKCHFRQRKDWIDVTSSILDDDNSVDVRIYERLN